MFTIFICSLHLVPFRCHLPHHILSSPHDIHRHLVTQLNCQIKLLRSQGIAQIVQGLLAMPFFDQLRSQFCST